MGKTYSNIVKEITESYIENIRTGGTIPEPGQMAEDLLEQIQNRINLEKAVLGDKSRRHKMPRNLENICIAELILAFYPVIRISWADSDRESNSMLFIYQTEGKDKGLYIPHENTFANLIREFNYCISERNMMEVRSILKQRAPLRSVTDNPDLIAVNNGIFDYQKKELRDFSPEYVFIAKTKVNYNPQSCNPVIHNPDDGTDWDVETWFDSLSDSPEIVELLWQVSGAVIRPNVPWNKVVCFYSQTGNNGKGTFCELLRQLCGKYAAISFEQFAQPFLLEQLIGASAVVGDENNTSAYLKDMETLKCVITGDCFTINGKFKKPVTFRFQGLMIQCVNNLPKFADKSESMARRLLMVPFEKCFTGQERKYIKTEYLKRTDVLEYVLYKVLHMSFYSFKEPQKCRNLLNEYKQAIDPVRQFLDEMLPELVWDLVPFSFLYSLYSAWYRKNVPSGSQQGKNTFRDEVAHIMINDPDWKVMKDQPHPTGKRMDDPEPLILEYGLNDWKNPCYRGNDPEKICTPQKKTSYRGLLRIKKAANKPTV